MFIKDKEIKHNLKMLLSITLLLIIIGFLFIYSSSSIYALSKYNQAHFFIKKQIIGLFLGLIGLIFFRLTPLEILKKYSPLIFICSLLLTILTLLPSLSIKVHGSCRWLKIAGITFQPSELLKIGLILYLSYFLSRKKGMLSSFTFGYLPYLIILSATSFILLKQPDFGLTAVLNTTAFILFFLAYFQLRHLFITISFLVPTIISLIYFYPYRLKRILTYLNPWQDPQGSGFQVIQSLIAIGSGSFLGSGISHSKQKFFYLPMQHTDFIFSIIAEETGFIGILILILLYISFLYFGIKIACQLKNSFSMFTVLGFTIIISLQAIINMFVATGLLPTKGIGLPFISYGNSALIANLCMMGIIINIVGENKFYS